MGTYYELLGVASDASPSDIKAAYRAMARLFHPDQYSGPNATALFLEIEAAYETLSDPGRRSQYDREYAAPRGVPEADFFDPDQAEYDARWAEYDALQKELDVRVGRLRRFAFDSTAAEALLADVLQQVARLRDSARSESTEELAGVTSAVAKLKSALQRCDSSWNLFKQRFADERRRRWEQMSVSVAARKARADLDAYERASRAAEPDQRPTFPWPHNPLRVGCGLLFLVSAIVDVVMVVMLPQSLSHARSGEAAMFQAVFSFAIVFAVHAAIGLAFLGWFRGVVALANLPWTRRRVAVMRANARRLKDEVHGKEVAATAAWRPIQQKIDALQRMERAF